MEKRVKSWVPYNGRPDRGLHPALGNPGAKEENLGLAVLTALSIAGLHSAVCPSYFTMVTFASQPEARTRAMDGLWISLGLSTLASVAIYGVWKNLAASITAEATALALFGIGIYAINQKPPTSIPSIEKQQTTQAAVQGIRPPGRLAGTQAGRPILVYAR